MGAGERPRREALVRYARASCISLVLGCAGRDLDYRAGFRVDLADIDPLNDGFGVRLSNANGLIYAATVLGSEIIPKGNIRWFYKNKGGTPGKLLLKLRVVNLESGTHIGWGKTFLREFIGKFIALLFIRFQGSWPQSLDPPGMCGM